MKLPFVTSNAGKLREAQALLAPFGVDVIGDATPTVEIQADRLDEIAAAKAERLRAAVRPPYFLEDAGLFVDALDGFPGPYSAYAFRTLGCQGILDLLDGRGTARRTARFEAVVAYVDARRALHLFPGRVRGRIAASAHGRNGFGFDPIFLPQGSPRTFGQLSPEEKNRVSHRGRALQALARFLLRGEPPKKRVKGAHRVRRNRALWPPP